MKSRFAATFVLIAATLAGSDAAATGLTSYWNGGASGGTVLASVGSNNGTFQGGATTTSGPFGTAYAFDGVNGYIKVPDAASLDFGTADFSISLWSKLNTTLALSQNDGLIHKGDYHTSNGWWIYINGTQVHFGRQTWSVQVSSPYADDQAWHHVAVTRESGTFRIYVDGIAGTSQTGTFNLDSANDVVLGAYGSFGADADFPLAGTLDEVGVFDEAMSAAKIAATHGLGAFSGVELTDAKIAAVLALNAAGQSVTGVGAANETWAYTSTFAAPQDGGLTLARGLAYTGVDGADYIILNGSGPGLFTGVMTPLPEPGSIVLALLGGVAGLRWRSKRGAPEVNPSGR